MNPVDAQRRRASYTNRAGGTHRWILVSIAPVLIGGAIPLIGVLARDIHLRPRAAHASNGGMTHATYHVFR